MVFLQLQRLPCRGGSVACDARKGRRPARALGHLLVDLRPRRLFRDGFQHGGRAWIVLVAVCVRCQREEHQGRQHRTERSSSAHPAKHVFHTEPAGKNVDSFLLQHFILIRMPRWLEVGRRNARSRAVLIQASDRICGASRCRVPAATQYRDTALAFRQSRAMPCKPVGAAAHVSHPRRLEAPLVRSRSRAPPHQNHPPKWISSTTSSLATRCRVRLIHWTPVRASEVSTSI